MQQAIADEQNQIANSINTYKKWSEMKKDPSLVSQFPRQNPLEGKLWRLTQNRLQQLNERPSY
jgi:hypothetical protein